MLKQLPNIRLVLVNTSHPGNIGGAARAMKTMGLNQLHLVAPKLFPAEEATARAAGADDVLENAHCHEDLASALADCALVIGTSARTRHLSWPAFSPAEAAARLLAEVQHRPVALVFGRERTGLTNEELDLCHFVVNIPTNPDYSSLNLASAVQIMAYEIRRLALIETPVETSTEAEEPLANVDLVEGMLAHLADVLVRLRITEAENAKLTLLRRFRRIFTRARLRTEEVHILRGLFAAMEKRSRAPEEL
ncbi:MAG: RNA methyltransferase [Gammaproteobacteria bacterium]|nr:RNA methyltransferase [Gammaproteobacteria bacterium]